MDNAHIYIYIYIYCRTETECFAPRRPVEITWPGTEMRVNIYISCMLQYVCVHV
jgi:hypothetical protein